MGYDISLRVKPEELKKEYKPDFKDRPKAHELDKRKHVLIAYCVNASLKENSIISLDKLYDELSFAFRFYANYYQEDWKWWLKDSLEKVGEFTKKDEISLCGWHLARSGGSHRTAEEIIYDYLEMLWWRVSTVPYVNYLEDADNYYKRKSDIEEIIEEFGEGLWDSMTEDFVNEYREANLCGGDDYPYPDDYDWSKDDEIVLPTTGELAAMKNSNEIKDEVTENDEFTVDPPTVSEILGSPKSDVDAINKWLEEHDNPKEEYEA